MKATGTIPASKNPRSLHPLRVFVVICLAGAMLFGGITASFAATHTGNPGYDYNPYNLVDQGGGWSGSDGATLGIIGWVNGKALYCIEAGVPEINPSNGSWSDATDTTSLIAANLVDRNKSDLSDFTQAAVAFALHEHLDAGSRWAVLRHYFGNTVTLEGGDIAAVMAHSIQLWNEAAKNLATSLDAQYQYTVGKRKGTVNPGITNASGQYTSGLAYTLSIAGPGVWDSTGSKNYSGITNGSAQLIPWTASGNGNVRVSISYLTPQGSRQSSSSQDLFMLPTSTNERSASIAFDVQRDFQPTLSTQMSDAALDAGATVVDRVTSGMTSGDQWASGVTVKAEGWYFTGSSANILKKITQTGTVANPESTGQYLERLTDMGLQPAAKATVMFDGSEQTKYVTAQQLDAPKNWVVPASDSGTFGTWVWLVDKEAQAEPEYIKQDFIHEFGAASETAAHRRPVAHDSVVLEQYSGLNRDIMDTITIGQLPEDYGTFSGSAPYGFSADTDARIRVWWAGSGTGIKGEDETYKPASATEPHADAHHKLLGEWTVPARNGIYKVGGGKITLQESGQGTARTVASGVDIIADDNSETGYYVFIYDFPGSTRAPAFTSAYNDPWERSFVELTPPNTPSIVTNVTKSEVAQGESFADVAKITGSLAPGSYVTFTAYDAVKTSPDTSADRLLDEVRVNLSAEQILQSQSKPLEVTSPAISTDRLGKVFWKVSLWNPAGMLMDSHALGIESETVSVRGVNIRTQVSSETVYVNEAFSDTAYIEGSVSRGSYVLFEALNPVANGPDSSTGKLLNAARVDITDTVADASQWGTSVSVVSPQIHTSRTGTVFWQARLYRADGMLLASHELGVAGESVRVKAPLLQTQTSRSVARPGETFRDAATITGQVPSGAYVAFTAFDAVQGDPNTGAVKLLDAVRVNLTAGQVTDSATKPVTVYSPYTSTSNSGSVFWQATLHAADGTLLASHELGLPSETVHVAPGGIVTSNAQKFGAVGEQLYDEITVYDESLQSESADHREHQGEGNSNDGGSVGRIPQGSTITVTVFRQGDDDKGNSGIYKLGSKTVTLDTNLFEPVKEGQQESRPGKLTLKVTDPSFILDTAGMVYWQTELKTPQGGVLDKHFYGEWNTDHETGYTSFERTPVQKFETTVSKQWLSAKEAFYEDSTVQVYDVLHQTAYEPFGHDSYTNGQTAQTPDGARVSFEIWSRDGERKDSRVAVLDTHDLPKLSKLGKSDDPDSEHPHVGTDDLDNYQNVKSETFTVPADWDASQYYYRVKITMPTTTAGKGTNPDNRNEDIVWYGGTSGSYSQSDRQTITYASTALGWDADEAFDVIRASTVSTEPLWLDTMHVADQVTLTGNIPENTQYEVEIWQTDTHDGTAIKKVTSTGRLPVPLAAIGSHLDSVTFRSKTLNAPAVGSYQHRLKLWTPEQPHQGSALGTGGDSAMSAAFSVITPAKIAQANHTSVSTDKQAGDYWRPATATQKGNGDGYADRWLLFDGTTVDAERFEIVRLTTRVKGTANVHTSQGDSYVDATNGVDVRDHLDIEGYMLAGYRVGFDLFRQVGDSATDDVRVRSVSPVALAEAQQALDSALVNIADPADYYWQWVFSKPDGTAFQPDNINPAVSAKRVKAESFHAVRVTTSTYRWASKGGKITDTARIEGVLPENATIRFELHDWASKAKVDETTAKTLKTLGYDTGEVDQEITGPGLEVPDATDWYWVEIVELPDDDVALPLHVGGERIKPESTRAIDARTDVGSEFILGTAVSDHADLTNVRWLQSGDIRDDLTGGLQARWLLWRQGEGNANTDTKVSTSAYTPLSSGQSEAVSPTLTPDETGSYYWQIEISDPSNNHKIVKLGEPRDPRESFSIINAGTSAQVMQQAGKTLQDKIRIVGPVLEGTLISWDLNQRWLPPAEDDLKSEETEISAQTLATQTEAGVEGEDTLVTSFAAPSQGAYLLTASDAETAAKDGEVTIAGPEARVDDVGEYYWVASLTAPAKDLTGDGLAKLPTDEHDATHLEESPFWTDRVHVLQETTQVVDAETLTQAFGHTDESFRDTVTFTGHILQGTQVDATLYKQTNGNDPAKDVKVLTTKRVVLADGQKSVELEEVSADMPGTYYWREHVYAPSSHTLPQEATSAMPVENKPFITGKPRLNNESISVIRITTTTNRVMALGNKLQDTALIEGDVPQDARIIFQLWQQDKGDDPAKDTLVFTADTVTVEAGLKQLNSPPFTPKEIGTYYWTESLYPPSDPNMPAEPCVTGVNNNPDPCEPSLHTEKPRTPGETVDVIRVTTKAQSPASIGMPAHDTASIEGQLPEGYRLAFEYWHQTEGGDQAQDSLITTTHPMAVAAYADHITSPAVQVSEQGTYYWRERLIESSTGRLVHYGEARLSDETTQVSELARTGTETSSSIWLLALLTLSGITLITCIRRR